MFFVNDISHIYDRDTVKITKTTIFLKRGYLLNIFLSDEQFLFLLFDRLYSNNDFVKFSEIAGSFIQKLQKPFS
jgi:hypothetical protein